MNYTILCGCVLLFAPHQETEKTLLTVRPGRRTSALLKIILITRDQRLWSLTFLLVLIDLFRIINLPIYPYHPSRSITLLCKYALQWRAFPSLWIKIHCWPHQYDLPLHLLPALLISSWTTNSRVRVRVSSFFSFQVRWFLSVFLFLNLFRFIRFKSVSFSLAFLSDLLNYLLFFFCVQILWF